MSHSLSLPEGLRSQDRATYIAEHFPFDTDWALLFHEKGQLSRASVEWIRSFFQARIDAGDSPLRLGVFVWINRQLGHVNATAWLSDLLRLHPDSARAFDAQPPAELSSELTFFADLFARASQSWTPPQEPHLRGWSKMMGDEQILSLSRERFSKASHLAQETLRYGSISAHLQALTLGSSGELQFLTRLDRHATSNHKDSLAFDFLLRALQGGSRVFDPAAHLSEERSIAIRGLFLFGKTRLRRLLASLSIDMPSRARLAGSCLREGFEKLAEQTAKLGAPPQLDAAQTEALWKQFLSDVASEDDFEDTSAHTLRERFEIQLDPHIDLRHALSVRSRTGSDSLAHLCALFSAPSKQPDAPDLMSLFLRSLCGVSIQDPGFGPKLRGIFDQLSSSTALFQASLSCGLFLRRHGLSIGEILGPDLSLMLWRYHADLTRSSARAYPHRHATLLLLAPNEEGQRLSIERAIPSHRAAIEHGEMMALTSEILAAQALKEEASGDSEEPRPAPRRARL